MLPGDAEDDAGELVEILIGQREAAERIADARVEAGRDHHELRLESIRQRYKPLTERRDNLWRARSRGERIVHDQAAALAFALLVGTAGARIPRVLMRVEEQHRAVAPEHRLRAVAVVDVPVGN